MREQQIIGLLTEELKNSLMMLMEHCSKLSARSCCNLVRVQRKLESIVLVITDLTCIRCIFQGGL